MNMQDVLADLQDQLSYAAAHTGEEDIVDNGDFYSLTVTVNINKEGVEED